MQDKLMHPHTDLLSWEKLPDGSIAVFDRRSNRAHSLKPAAAAVWEACREGATLDELRTSLSHVDRDAVLAAVYQLRQADLLETDAPAAGLPPDAGFDPARRSALKAAAAIGALVITLTAAEQKAFAGAAPSDV